MAACPVFALRAMPARSCLTLAECLCSGIRCRVTDVQVDEAYLSSNIRMIRIPWALAGDRGDRPRRSVLPCLFGSSEYPL
jgi:hypothetical protein